MIELEKYLLEMAVQQSMDGVAITDMEGKIMYTNLAWALMHGFYQSEVRGENIHCFLGPSTNTTANGVLGILREQGCYSGEHANIKKDSTSFSVLLSANIARNDIGDPVGMVFLIRDITDMKKFQEELKESKNDFRQIVNLVDEGLIIVDTKETVLFANACAMRMLAKSEDEVIGEKLGVPLADAEVAEVNIVNASGGLGTARISVIPLEWKGEPARLVLISGTAELTRVERSPD